MPFSDGNPTLGEQIEEQLRWREEVGPILKEANELAQENKALRAALREAVEALDAASKLICPSCNFGYPTDKEWEGDGVDRENKYHVNRNYSDTGFGGGFHKCNAWKARAARDKAKGLLDG